MKKADEVSADLTAAAAAAAAVAEQTDVEPEITPEPEVVKESEKESVKEPEIELDEDGLPVEHKLRSDLGRKFSALHKRQDNFDEKLDKLLDVLSKRQDPKDEFDEIDDNMSLTKAEATRYFEKLASERESKAESMKKAYQDKYDNSLVNELSSSYEEAEANAIFEELLKIKYTRTSDPEKDALANILKAERAYFRKLAAKPADKVAPLKKDPVTGVVTSQKTVTKESPPVKLDAVGQSYLNFVARHDGEERAKELLKSL